jgi:EF-hand domain pair
MEPTLGGSLDDEAHVSTTNRSKRTRTDSIAKNEPFIMTRRHNQYSTSSFQRKRLLPSYSHKTTPATLSSFDYYPSTLSFTLKMTRNTAILMTLSAAATLSTSSAFAFAPALIAQHRQAAFVLSSSPASTMERTDLPYFADFTPTPSAPKKIVKKSGGAVHKKGLLSPVVLASKAVLGETKLNEVRAKAISLHGDVIKRFVETADTVLGQRVLEQLFALADVNRSGTIDIHELKVALHTLGFEWLREEQVRGIFERADTDTNGAIDLDEWIKEAPKTLKTNLVKLAKKNGGDMGLLV